jgi:TonB-dependent receptor
VLWGGIANFSSLVGGSTLVALNNMFTRSADNEARADTGLLQGGIDLPGRRQTLSFIERTVRSNQLKLERSVGRQTFDVALTSSATARREPDRSSFVQVRYENLSQPGSFSPYRWFAGSDEGAKRSFSDLREHSEGVGADWKLGFGSQAAEGLIKIGGNYRDTKRDVEQRIYSIRGGAISASDLELRPESIFDGRFAQDSNSVLTPVNNTQTGFYSARDRVAAGYAMTELPLGSRLRLIGGARVEQWTLHLDQQLLNAGDPNTPDKRSTDVLPSVALNFKINESQSLRLSAARTLSRPEYREVSRTLFCETLGEPCTIGNDSLTRALIQNYDARWEVYPAAGELFSVGLFAKRFSNPIERVEVATSGASNYSFVNTEGATNYGVELEMRTGLARLARKLEPITAFSNVTLMRSEIQVGNSQISALTSDKRAMTGQSPYVVNAGFTFSPVGSRRSATLLYNVVGERIAAVGSKPVADTYELARHMLDVAVQFPAYRDLMARINAKNLFDAPVRQTSGEVTRLEYRTGRILQLGFTWQRGDAP